MKTILCYGDSLTWGSNPENGGRHAFEDRWPSVLGAELGEHYVHVIAEGLGGRTTAFDDYEAIADRNGVRVLPTLLASHQPLDAVIIMLGTNDMKDFICGSAAGAARGMRRLGEIVRAYPYSVGKVPELILVSPPQRGATDESDMTRYFPRAPAETALLANAYQQISQEFGCAFFDAATVAKASPLDGVHLDAKNTRAIGSALVPIVRKVLNI